MRCYPENDCHMYVEYPSANFPTVGIRHRPDLTKNYPKIIYSWRSGPEYEKWTGYDKGPYLPGTRLLAASLKVAGQTPRYRYNQAKPVSFNLVKEIEFNLKEWLDQWRGSSGKKIDNGDKTKKSKGKKGGKKKEKKR